MRSPSKRNRTYALISMMAIIVLLSMAVTGCAVVRPKAYAMASVAQAQSSPKSDPFIGDEDKRDAGWQIGGGVNLTRFVAVEAAYVDLGTTAFDGEWDGVSDVGTIDKTGIRASVLGIWPITEKFSLFGKAGMCRWEVDEAEVYAGIPESHSADGTDPTFGIGVGFKLTDRIGFRGEWERFLDVGEVDVTGQDDVDFVSASVVLKF